MAETLDCSMCNRPFDSQCDICNGHIRGQLKMVFDMTGRQLDLPFPQSPCENHEENMRLKRDLATGMSESDKLTTKAKLITNKQVILQPNQ